MCRAMNEMFVQVLWGSISYDAAKTVANLSVVGLRFFGKLPEGKVMWESPKARSAFGGSCSDAGRSCSRAEGLLVMSCQLQRRHSSDRQALELKGHICVFSVTAGRVEKKKINHGYFQNCVI